MGLKEVMDQLNPPCRRCPYQLGLVQTLDNPCPQCKRQGYELFKRFLKRQIGK
ncbi:MAG: hypothetical protein K2O18_17040 [Oscillospiraceae bacterium]|nr:hypothetical protein [Oscillospiraceae bacterium]